jgi:hypothetical protein
MNLKTMPAKLKNLKNNRKQLIAMTGRNSLRENLITRNNKQNNEKIMAIKYALFCCYFSLFSLF